MLREQAKLFNRLAMLCDASILSISFFLAYFIRSEWQRPVGPWEGHVWVLLIFVPAMCTLLYWNKLYASIRRLSTFDIITRLINAILPASIIVAAFIYFFDRHDYSRSFYGIFILVSFVLLVLEKLFVRSFLGFFRRRGLNTRNLIIVGTFDRAVNFTRLVKEHSDWGLRVLGYVQVSEGDLREGVEGQRVLGRVDDLVSICKSFPVDEVVFCLQKDHVVDADVYFKQLEEMGVTVRMILDFFDVSSVRKEITMFHGHIPMLTFHSKVFDSQQLFLKRTLDVVGAFVGLGLLALLFPFVAIAIKLDSRGPLFFGQERVGENGRRFKCWKFRSMYIDAEVRKKELMSQNEMDGAIFKIKKDPRITRVGKFIRKTSLDEFPQFWNVLIGEMSLVGTRPPTPDEVDQYANWQRRRCSIKPGITGMWQVNGRNTIEDFDDIVRLDLYYIDNWSFWFDIKILLKTIYVVVAREGSC